MEIYKKINTITERISALKKEEKSIGFVPTMGALHEGHISLIKNSIQENDVTIASIFVNPTQFNDPNDLENYPRTIDTDIEKLDKAHCDIVFIPNVEEMYLNQEKRKFDFGYIEKIMEGKYRIGHFNGVATIVSKFFDIIKPDNAYFGQKDFQQLAIIKNLVKQYNYNINIVAGPTIRERDGLAMSSRNKLLTNKQREIAPLIFKTLKKAVKKADDLNIEELKKWLVEQINSNKLMKVEYFDVVNTETLKSIVNWDKKCKITGCIAIKIGKIRLIDNINFNY